MGVLTSYFYTRGGGLRGPGLRALMARLTAASVPTMLDSGAYSAHHRGQPIEVGEYVSFLRGEGRGMCHEYIQLDKILDRETSRRWLLEMRDAGLTPMPVLTADDDEGVVAGWAAWTDRVCVAGNPRSGRESWLGSARTLGDAFAAYRARCLRLRAASPGVRLHALSLTEGSRAIAMRLASVDSSSWVSGQRHATVAAFVPHVGAIQTTWRRALAKPRYVASLLRHGVSVGDFARSSMDRRTRASPFSERAVASAYAWVEAHRWARTLGTRVYFAVVHPYPTIALAAACAMVARGDPLFSSAADDLGRLRRLWESRSVDGLAEEMCRMISPVLG